jgi:iron complex transport system substrate-binding protein
MVGVSSYDTFPPEATTLPRVGALLDPDVERILSLRPDLVITYVSQTELERQLGRAGIRIFSDRHGGVATILQTLRDVGRETGHTQEADTQAREIQSRLDGIRARVSGRRRPRTLLVFGRQPGTLQQLYAAGGQGFLHDMLEIAGGENVLADIRRDSVQPSHEALIARAPDVVLELQATRRLRSGEAEDTQKAWSALTSIPAVRNRRVLLLSADYLVVPGPRVAMAVEAMARALHPDAFK